MRYVGNAEFIRKRQGIIQPNAAEGTSTAPLGTIDDTLEANRTNRYVPVETTVNMSRKSIILALSLNYGLLKDSGGEDIFTDHDDGSRTYPYAHISVLSLNADGMMRTDAGIIEVKTRSLESGPSEIPLEDGTLTQTLPAILLELTPGASYEVTNEGHVIAAEDAPLSILKNIPITVMQVTVDGSIPLDTSFSTLGDEEGFSVELPRLTDDRGRSSFRHSLKQKLSGHWVQDISLRSYAYYPRFNSEWSWPPKIGEVTMSLLLVEDETAPSTLFGLQRAVDYSLGLCGNAFVVSRGVDTSKV